MFTVNRPTDSPTYTTNQLQQQQARQYAESTYSTNPPPSYPNYQ